MSKLGIISSMYIHFPYCKNLCNYCDFYKMGKKDYGEYSDFHGFLKKSFNEHEKLISKYGFQIGKLKTLYIGGGTPSLWGQTGSCYLKQFLINYFDGFEEDYEFTIEMNPNAWKEEDLAKWKEIGVNRLSVGVQSLDPHFFKWLDRGHQIEDSFKTLKYLQSNNWNFTIDFMLGLPEIGSFKRNIITELEQALQYDPKHLSIYILTPKEKYPSKLKQSIPSDEYIREEYLRVSSFLKEKGFCHYEVSNYAKNGYESKHNLSYWDSKSVMALGPSAAGLLLGGPEEVAIRYKWKEKDPEMDIEKLGHSERLLEEIYLSLRTSYGFDYSLLPSKEVEVFKNLVSVWSDRGYILEVRPRPKLSSLGYLMLDSIMDDIFTHIKIP